MWGIDVAEQAITEFFAAHSMPFTKVRSGNFDIFKNEDQRINLIVGDYFALSPELVRDFDAVWDRASFVAINPDDRERYTMKKRSILLIYFALFNFLSIKDHVLCLWLFIIDGVGRWGGGR